MRDELEKYNETISDIKRIDKEIAKLKREEISIGGSNFQINGDIRPKGFMNSGIENKIISNVDKIKYLELLKEEKKSQIEYIDSLLNTLKYNERNLLIMYYIEKKNMSIIQSIYKRDADSIYKSISIYIGKLDEKYKNEVNL